MELLLRMRTVLTLLFVVYLVVSVFRQAPWTMLLILAVPISLLWFVSWIAAPKKAPPPKSDA